MATADERYFWGYGYTLVEIMIVMGIMVLLLGSGMAAYIKFNNTRKVEQAALDFATYLKMQQKRADVGEKPDACTDVLDGYRVASYDDKSVQTQAKCGNIINMPSFYLDNRAYFYGPFEVTFQVLSRQPDIVGDGELRVVSDKPPAPPKDAFLVRVNNWGSITVEKL